MLDKGGTFVHRPISPGLFTLSNTPSGAVLANSMQSNSDSMEAEERVKELQSRAKKAA
jgi:hypothetical protein